MSVPWTSNKVLMGILSLSGITVGGAGIYKLISVSTENKKIQSENRTHKHKKIFDKLSKDYLSKTFIGPRDEKVTVEIIDPSDPWWKDKWQDYKTQNLVFPKEGKEKTEKSLEDFQGVCFEEIRRRGPNFGDTAKYVLESGKLRNLTNKDFLSSNEMKERKFSWEYCVKVTIS